MPMDVKTMEIRAPNVSIPNKETTYWCYITELPPGFARHHIIMVCGDPFALLSILAPRVTVVLLVRESEVLA